LSERILRYFSKERPATPCLVVDTEHLKKNYGKLKYYFENFDVFYAVKANPGTPVIKTLGKLGSYFDIASVQEMELCMAAGIKTNRMSYGNTIKKERDIKRAMNLSFFGNLAHRRTKTGNC
jgi:ornithine decarboxylase